MQTVERLWSFEEHEIINMFFFSIHHWHTRGWLCFSLEFYHVKQKFFDRVFSNESCDSWFSVYRAIDSVARLIEPNRITAPATVAKKSSRGSEAINNVLHISATLSTRPRSSALNLLKKLFAFCQSKSIDHSSCLSVLLLLFVQSRSIERQLK